MRWAILLPVVALATPATAQRYLTGPGVALRDVLPPAPQAGSAAEAADLAYFRATRSMQGSPRWRQAIADTEEAVPAMLADFTAAAGRRLSPEATPHLARLLTRIRGDVATAVNAVKRDYARPRPYQLTDGAVCQPVAALSGSFDYPSGHTTWGTAISLLLAELIPGRATPILARGRDYGDSRAICGAHSVSAVNAGRIAAGAIVATLHERPDFRRDLEAARSEIDGGAPPLDQPRR